MSTVKIAECIFVVERGKIVEYGKHEELFRQGGMCYEMCMAQSLDRAVRLYHREEVWARRGFVMTLGILQLDFRHHIDEQIRLSPKHLLLSDKHNL